LAAVVAAVVAAVNGDIECFLDIHPHKMVQLRSRGIVHRTAA